MGIKDHILMTCFKENFLSPFSAASRLNKGQLLGAASVKIEAKAPFCMGLSVFFSS